MKTIGWGLIGCGDDIARKEAGASRPGFRRAGRGQPRRLNLRSRCGRIWRAKMVWHMAGLLAIPKSRPSTSLRLFTCAEQAIAAAEAANRCCAKPGDNPAMRSNDRRLSREQGNARCVFQSFLSGYRTRGSIQSGEIGRRCWPNKPPEYFNPEADHPRHCSRRINPAAARCCFGCHGSSALKYSRSDNKSESNNLERPVRSRSRTRPRPCFSSSGNQRRLAVTHASREAQDALEIFGSRGSIHVPVLNKGRCG